MKRRTVITGIGIISPLGCKLDDVWNNALAGTSGVVHITRFDTTDYQVKIAGQVRDFDVDAYISKKDQRKLDLFSQYALAAATDALRNSGLDLEREDLERIGVIASSGIGGLETLQNQHSVLIEKGPTRCSPFMIPEMISNIASGLIAIEFNLQGPNCCMVSACATSAHSLGYAQRHIERGEADVMLAGGSEAAVIELGVAGFTSMKALTMSHKDDPGRASRPFDLDRDGFVMADGAAIVVLEEFERAKARGAEIFCELAGFGQTCDAHHITAPMESGDGGARAMRLSIEDAGLSADDVDYINAHGTSTVLNDRTETRAIKTALGEEKARRTMISSTKSMTGHLLGAAGSIEASFCALAIKHGVIPPTINIDTPDPDCDLDYVPNEAREARVSICMSNSLGFGGHNVCLVLRELS